MAQPNYSDCADPNACHTCSITYLYCAQCSAKRRQCYDCVFERIDTRYWGWGPSEEQYLALKQCNKCCTTGRCEYECANN